MLPVPSLAAKTAFYASVGLSLIGIVSRSPACLVLGSFGVLGLALALAITAPLGRRARQTRLEFAWWLSHGHTGTKGGAVVPRAPFEIRCYIRNRAPYGLDLESLMPVVGPNLDVQTPEGSEPLRSLWVAPGCRTEFAFTLRAPAPGRLVLHGLSVELRGPLGLFRVPLYFPNPLVVKVLPKAAARKWAKRSAPTRQLDRSGRSRLRQRGGGTELYELRELLPGDPYKSIAWKASARFGKLLVREVEQEVQASEWFILDVSGTMRGGPLGQRKLDTAIEYVASEAKSLLDAGGRAGLITLDSRVIEQEPPADGHRQLLRIFESLLNVTELVDQDLTTVTEAEVVDRVGRYLRHQDGIEFQKSGADTWDVAQMVAHVNRLLPRGQRQKREGPLAENGALRVLRSFCQARGLGLAHRSEPADGAKASALSDAMLRAIRSRKSPVSITVITDFDGARNLVELERAVSLARRYQHSVRFLVPNGIELAEAAEDSLGNQLRTIYQRGERRRLSHAVRRLGRLGTEVRALTGHNARPHDSLAADQPGKVQREQRI